MLLDYDKYFVCIWAASVYIMALASSVSLLSCASAVLMQIEDVSDFRPHKPSTLCCMHYLYLLFVCFPTDSLSLSLSSVVRGENQ